MIGLARAVFEPGRLTLAKAQSTPRGEGNDEETGSQDQQETCHPVDPVDPVRTSPPRSWRLGESDPESSQLTERDAREFASFIATSVVQEASRI